MAGIFGLPEGAAQLFISTAHNSKSFTEFLDKRFEDYEKVQVKNIKDDISTVTAMTVNVELGENEDKCKELILARI